MDIYKLYRENLDLSNACMKEQLKIIKYNDWSDVRMEFFQLLERYYQYHKGMSDAYRHIWETYD
jgi:hypothetical protein